MSSKHESQACEMGRLDFNVLFIHKLNFINYHIIPNTLSLKEPKEIMM